MHQLVFHSARALEAGKQNDRSFYSLPSPEVGVDVQQRIAGFFTLYHYRPRNVFTVHRRRVVGQKTEKGVRWQDAPDAVRFKQ
jgi:hypothetical protein